MHNQLHAAGLYVIWVLFISYVPASGVNALICRCILTKMWHVWEGCGMSLHCEFRLFSNVATYTSICFRLGFVFAVFLLNKRPLSKCYSTSLICIVLISLEFRYLREVQIKTWRLFGTSSFNQCWLIDNWIVRNKHHGNMNQNTTIFI